MSIIKPPRTAPRAAAPAAAGAEESFAELFKAEEQAAAAFNEGQVIDAMVVAIEDKSVLVESGLKSQSRIPLEEFLSDDGGIEIKAEDFVKVKLEYADDGRGNTRLSHLQYRREKAWSEIEEAFEAQTPIEGVVKERIKGGYSVHVGGLRAFLPGSLVDVFPLKSETSLVGRREKFYVERLKPERHSAILNRKLVRERELTGGDLANLPFKEGDVLAGTVVAINDYSEQKAYIRVAEGVHGVLHREDFSWHRIGQMSESLSEDEELQVKVLSIDAERQSIRLGVKQLSGDPWDDMEKTYPVGAKIFAKVVSLKEYGAFVEIEKGVEGLVHVSEMDWLQRNVDPTKHLEPGQHVEVMMLSLDKAARRISLGLKQCRPNPWEEFGISYKKGSRLQGKVVGVQNNLGMFVELPGGLNGLAHLSNLSYSDPSGRTALSSYKVGDEIEVMVIEVDVAKQRIALGVKQLGEDPLNAYRVKYEKREPVIGTVKKITESRAFVKLSDEVEAVLPIKEVSKARIDKISDVVKEGEELQFAITGIDDRGRITVSLRALDRQSERAAMKSFKEEVKAEQEAKATSAGSFGSVLLETMKGGKQDAEEAEAKDAAAEEQPAAEAKAAAAAEEQPAEEAKASAAAAEQPEPAPAEAPAAEEAKDADAPAADEATEEKDPAK
ncbi:MAG: S1 RNA-binding domain-containing protein [Betaproteobacteria bacterium AqS2]|uniref:Small ribosomal subunit protein bS1 n=1 Tax=Candidatus Amphirhobacter heronislandensis TaxID=1732024 RepID=A0A930UID9_9GAMM|nr:S1 RNA-binding domain-containing protein [Betaproteobacteria bacterium AqS2]